MKVEQILYSNGKWSKDKTNQNAQWVTVFGSRNLLSNAQLLQDIEKFYPKAIRMGCSTAGEIEGSNVHDETLSVTAVEFSKTRLKVKCVDVAESSIQASQQAGRALKEALVENDLVHVFVLSDGLIVNGTHLVEGLTQGLPKGVSVTGGLAGDGSAFQKTLIYFDHAAKSNQVVAVGFYGPHLKVSYGSMGGWDPYGILRKITKSDGNVLHELDGKPALDLYKEYLGEERSKELPGSALLFPLNMLQTPGDKDSVVRTVLAVDPDKKTMTFAGDVPEGHYAQFMKANFNRLVEAASTAASNSMTSDHQSVDLAILISCVGRKLVLKQRIEEETEAVREALGEAPIMTGFYSYGEISPFTPHAKCELHNQTMTITTFHEED